jgi:hypothetical protein
VIAIFNYIEAMVRADRFLPPPAELAPQVFDVFDWPAPELASSVADSPGLAALASDDDVVSAPFVRDRQRLGTLWT